MLYDAREASNVQVNDLTAAAHQLSTENGVRALGQPRTGAHGHPVLFLHPADTHGVLVELQQTQSAGPRDAE